MEHIFKHKNKYIFLGITPALIVYFLFVLVPIIISFYYSFIEWNGFSPDLKFVALDNFIDMFQNSIFWISLKNNIVVILASVFGQVPLGLLLALLVNQKIKGSHFFRTVIFLPVVISAVIISLIWSMVYNYQFGLINKFLRIVGLNSWAQNWLGDPNLAMYSVAITVIWQFIGLYFVIFLAALQNVPKEILEAAEIDGAHGLKRTFHIIIPIIWDTILASIVLCISGSLKIFGLIYVMTNGGPAHSTEVLALHLYEKSFSSLRYGYGSAVSVFVVIFGLFLVITIKKLFNRKTV
ncbi:carbohydrate ABC transporter permease [Halothermothrix orenii]|uniref:Binding-protein-dependent transport systems inner membrane component n=1 Tax=Halothermothrix orenii (strain H 168 / OCM 544 / DSM 9562) TaxID=373903 RepID=B8CXP4_HALOH|nr:sugar ABC transporter permease [Halothermothrix orenii]ACL70063.1 binding-protein-dependent transport systems inner membrane component [Halothermothrix orenii H 168]